MSADIRRIAEGISASRHGTRQRNSLWVEAHEKGVWDEVIAALADIEHQPEPDPEPPTDYYEAAVDAELAHDWAMAAEVKQ